MCFINDCWIINYIIDLKFRIKVQVKLVDER